MILATRFCLTTLLWLALVSYVCAELPSPRLDRIAPLGASAGTSVDVEVQGSDLEEPQLRFEHSGITATPIAGKDRWFKVTVAADVPEATYDCRVSGKYGISSPRLFAVSQGLADVLEIEPNNTSETAQKVPLNSALASTSDGNDQDVFRFTATKGQRLTIDCQATRLDSALDASLTITSASGAVLASSGDYFGRDPFIDFIAPDSGDYLIIANDLSFRGGLPYRLVISERPYVENVFPRVAMLDQPANVTILGRNLGAGSQSSAWTLLDKPLEERQQTVACPAGVFEFGAYRFIEHPTQHSVQPTAATCTLTGWQFRPDGGGRPALNAITMMASRTPVTLEAEPNERAKPQLLGLPATVSGRFDKPRDADWYEFEATENGALSVDVYCERIAGQADPYVVFFDDKDARMQELDDFGHRINAFDGHLRDPSGTINVNAGKKYRVLVQDRYQRGGARYQYVLSIRKAEPDFYIAAMHAQNPGPGGATLWRGGATYLDIIVHQQGGYNGPVTLTAEQLPPGVHAAPTTIGAGNSGTFVLWADENAEPFVGPIKLIATGKNSEQAFSREVRPYTRVWQQGDGSSRVMRDQVLAVREKAPYALKFPESKVAAVSGQKVEVKLTLERLWADFKEPLNILPLAWPGNFKTNNGQFSGDGKEITLSIEVQANTRPGEYTLAVLGQGQVPFTKEADGKNKQNTLVSLPSQPLTIVVAAPAK